MPAQTSGHVAGETDVITIGILVAAEDIHEPAWFHVPARGTNYATAQAHAFVRHVRTTRLKIALFAIAGMHQCCRKCDVLGVRLRRCAATARQPSHVSQLAWLGRRSRPSRSSPEASEGWLGGRDSNPDNVVQSHVSYR